MINAPCLDCTDRKLNCHADCKKYKDYRAELKIVKANTKLASMNGRQCKPNIMFGQRY